MCKVCNVASWSGILPDQLATLQTLLKQNFDI